MPWRGAGGVRYLVLETVLVDHVDQIVCGRGGSFRVALAYIEVDGEVDQDLFMLNRARIVRLSVVPFHHLTKPLSPAPPPPL